MPGSLLFALAVTTTFIRNVVNIYLFNYFSKCLAGAAVAIV